MMRERHVVVVWLKRFPTLILGEYENLVVPNQASTIAGGRSLSADFDACNSAHEGRLLPSHQRVVQGPGPPRCTSVKGQYELHRLGEWPMVTQLAPTVWGREAERWIEAVAAI